MKDEHTLTGRSKTVAFVVSTILTVACALPVAARDRDKDDFPSKTRIKHVVVIFQENRTFDHYFATYPFAANSPGEPKFVARDDTPAVNNLLAAGLLNNNPNLRQPFRYTRAEAYTCSLDHNYTDEQKAVNGGLNDMYVQATSRVGFGCRERACRFISNPP